MRYIHLNPVRAGRVKEPADYRWSGHRTYLGREAVEWLTVEWVLSRFAERLQHARQGYAAFVAAGPAEGYLEHFHRGAEGGRMLGDDTFIEQTLRAVQGEPVKPPTLSQLLNGICNRRGLDGATLGSAIRSHAYVEGRALLTYLATELHSATLSEVAKVTNRDIATLSRAVRQFRERLVKESELYEEVRSLKEELLMSTIQA